MADVATLDREKFVERSNEFGDHPIRSTVLMLASFLVQLISSLQGFIGVPDAAAPRPRGQGTARVTNLTYVRNKSSGDSLCKCFR